MRRAEEKKNRHEETGIRRSSALKDHAQFPQLCRGACALSLPINGKRPQVLSG